MATWFGQRKADSRKVKPVNDGNVGRLYKQGVAKYEASLDDDNRWRDNDDQMWRCIEYGTRRLEKNGNDWLRKQKWPKNLKDDCKNWKSNKWDHYHDGIVKNCDCGFTGTGKEQSKRDWEALCKTRGWDPKSFAPLNDPKKSKKKL